MSIRIVDDHADDVCVTEDEYRRYLDEYRSFCRYYCGTPPSLESYIRGARNRKVPMPAALGRLWYGASGCSSTI